MRSPAPRGDPFPPVRCGDWSAVGTAALHGDDRLSTRIGSDRSGGEQSGPDSLLVRFDPGHADEHRRGEQEADHDSQQQHQHGIAPPSSAYWSADLPERKAGSAGFYTGTAKFSTGVRSRSLGPLPQPDQTSRKHDHHVDPDRRVENERCDQQPDPEFMQDPGSKAAVAALLRE